MHLPAVHAESSLPVLRKLIRDNPLGLLTTSIPSSTHAQIQASHIPFIIDCEDESSETELGALRAHMARQNPQSQAMIESLTADGAAATTLEQDVLVIFTAAPQHYVTPRFYVETKPTTAKVVPTWNYAAVQVYGRATVYFDSHSDATSRFLDKQMHDLSEHSEKQIMDYTGKGDRPGPWKVSDAPEKYIELMKKNIIGIEIAITRLEGKFKMSQEMRKGDRDGVVEGFSRLGSEVGNAVSGIVRARSEAKDS